MNYTPTSNLNFVDDTQRSGNISFGVVDSTALVLHGSYTGNYTATISAEALYTSWLSVHGKFTPNLSGRVTAETTYVGNLNLHGVFKPNFIPQFEVYFDINVWRGVVGENIIPYAGENIKSIEYSNIFNNIQSMPQVICISYVDGTFLSISNALTFKNNIKLTQELIVYHLLKNSDNSISLQLSSPPPLPYNMEVPELNYNTENARQLENNILYRHLYRLYNPYALPYSLPNITSKEYLLYAPPPANKSKEFMLNWKLGMQRIGISSIPYVPLHPPIIPPVIDDNQVDVNGLRVIKFNCRLQYSANIVFSRTKCLTVQENHYMSHNVEVKIINTGFILPVINSITLDTSADEYAWTCKFNLFGRDSWDLLDISIEEVYIQVKINDYVWKMVVEDVTHSESFGNRSITVTARSLTALLSERYKPLQSGTISVDMTVDQLIETFLPSDWTYIWSLPSWLVPGGCFTYQNLSPIAIVASIANSCGAIITPSFTEKTLIIKKRYPKLPWNFTASSPDYNISENSIVSKVYRVKTIPQANAVYVRGPDTGGILARCWLSGTDGTILATDIQTPLVTDVAGARAVAERVLSSKYTQPTLKSFTMPFGGSYFPLIPIGSFVGIGEVRGVVGAISITASIGSGLRQTITLGEDISSWGKYKALLKDYPLLVGAVVAKNSDGTVTLSTTGGNITVRGTEEFGTSVYYRNGVTEGAAPVLPTYDVEVI